ncbi:TetR/AcrR family transcriptional regulator [Wohlfahrtiimonas populi]|uniref:TetR/AcrR family transcriptional regulator n=1 Tax=Wohlfahrtiimonas populi TaxID=1940240 RepID=UPI00098D60B5|nr:TetR/AcrR family transcriptional regulator [Wohlfahrtiimonas populi]
MTKPVKLGRPKTFDEQAALEKAMLLFWENGYIATSISDLTKALGITAPSLYCSFGDKATLFNRCIDYYLANEACPIVPILKQAKTTKVAFELFLYDTAKRLVQPDKPMGCMLVTTTLGNSKQIQEVQHNIQEKKESYRTLLMQRLQQGVEDGDIAPNTPIQDILDFYLTIFNGLSIKACDGADLETLNRIICNAIKAWPVFEG